MNHWPHFGANILQYQEDISAELISYGVNDKESSEKAVDQKRKKYIYFNVRSDLQRIEAMVEDQKGNKPQLPSVIHFGERKTGTTALMHFLRSHPQVRSPQKETHFFDIGKNYQKGLLSYVNLMPPTTQDEISSEKTASYFHIVLAYQSVLLIRPCQI